MADETTKIAFNPQPMGKPIQYERVLWQARFAPCGQWLIGVGQDQTIQRWKISEPTTENESGATLAAPFAGHDGWVQNVGFHPSNGRMFTADSWGRLSCYPYQSEAAADPIWTNAHAHEGWIRSLVVSADGKLIATGGNDAIVRIWSTDDGKLVREWPHGSKVMSLAFTGDGSSLVTGDLPGMIREWKTESGDEVRELSATILYQKHNNQECGGVRRLVFDPSGQRLAAVGQKEPNGGFATGMPCVLVFDWQTGEIIRPMPVGDKDDGFAYDVLFHPAGYVMAVSSAFPNKGPLWCWRPEEETPFLVEKKFSNGLSLSLHPDGKRLALLVADAPNANGRPLNGGDYVGGKSKLHLLMVT